MNLSKLMHNVWKDERVKSLKLKKGEVKTVIIVMIDHIVKGLAVHKKVKLRGLFTIDVREVKARRIANPQTKEPMMTQDYYKIGIEQSQNLRDELKKS